MMRRWFCRLYTWAHVWSPDSHVMKLKPSFSFFVFCLVDLCYYINYSTAWSKENNESSDGGFLSLSSCFCLSPGFIVPLLSRSLRRLTTPTLLCVLFSFSLVEVGRLKCAFLFHIMRFVSCTVVEHTVTIRYANLVSSSWDKFWNLINIVIYFFCHVCLLVTLRTPRSRCCMFVMFEAVINADILSAFFHPSLVFLLVFLI